MLCRRAFCLFQWQNALKRTVRLPERPSRMETASRGDVLHPSSLSRPEKDLTARRFYNVLIRRAARGMRMRIWEPDGL